jgi:hypothetical protein
MLLIHLSGIFLQALIAANAVYELSDIIKENIPRSYTSLAQYNFNEYFHEYEFL